VARLREVDIWVNHERGDHAISQAAEGTFRAITLAAGMWLSTHEVSGSRAGLRIVLQDAPRAAFVFEPQRDHVAYPIGPGDWIALYAIGSGFTDLDSEDRWRRAAAVVVEVIDSYAGLTTDQRRGLRACICAPRPSVTWFGEVVTSRGRITCLRVDVAADGSLFMHLLAVERSGRHFMALLPCDPTTLRYQPSDLKRLTRNIAWVSSHALRVLVPMRDHRNLGYDATLYLQTREPQTIDGQVGASDSATS
jgi:hypothetical protein